MCNVVCCHLFEQGQSIQLSFCSVFSAREEGNFEELMLGFAYDDTERTLPREHIIGRKSEMVLVA